MKELVTAGKAQKEITVYHQFIQIKSTRLVINRFGFKYKRERLAFTEDFKFWNKFPV